LGKLHKKFFARAAELLAMTGITIPQAAAELRRFTK